MKKYHFDEKQIKLHKKRVKDALLNEIKTLDMTLVDITNVMELNDYYETDTHWKQENLNKVVKEMSHFMNFKYKETKYIKNTYDKDLINKMLKCKIIDIKEYDLIGELYE